MKLRRVTIRIVLAVAAICIVGAVAFWVGSHGTPAVSLKLGAVSIDPSYGWPVVAVTLTNRSSSSYKAILHAQTKPPTGWGDPPEISYGATNYFVAGGGTYLGLLHTSGEDFTMLTCRGVPWRVVGEFYHEEPAGFAKYWFRFRDWLRHDRPSLVIVTPEMPPI